MSLITAGVLLYVAAVQAEQPPPDWLIVPGERVGPVTATTSEVMLERLFGADNVERVDVHLGEGFTEPGTTVFPGAPTERIEIVWRDDARAAPREVRLTGDASRWRTAEGISLGSTLKEIEHLNGFPFRLVGFGFDYGGTITHCGRGRLRMLSCSSPDEAPQGRLVILRLGPAVRSRMRPEYGQVLGDRDFSSGHSAMQALNPRVYQMILSFPQ
ncbi:MAG: hypothetical protein ABFS02_09070 [Pseudomonadota bacterium]